MKPIEPDYNPKINFKELYEQLGITEEEMDELRKKRVENGMRLLKVYMLIRSRGGNIHGVNHQATAKRRAANKVARQQRRRNR